MKRPLFSPPDPFGLQPLLSLFPVRGSVSRLEGLRSSLFARHEKVAAQRKTLADQLRDKEQIRRCEVEEGMLREVLQWISSTSGGGADGV